ncbi:hypothetical protein PsYK624_160490, partial [Phanerochaete sordida]
MIIDAHSTEPCSSDAAGTRDGAPATSTSAETPTTEPAAAAETPTTEPAAAVDNSTTEPAAAVDNSVTNESTDPTTQSPVVSNAANTLQDNATTDTSEAPAAPGGAFVMPNGLPILRKAKTKQEREAAKGGKAGNPGNFVGVEKDILEPLVAEFIAIDRSTGSGKTARFDAFWYKVSRVFWGSVTLERMREILGVKLQGLDDQHAFLKSNDIIKEFFRWKRKSAGSEVKDVWGDTFRALKKSSYGAPRMTSGPQTLQGEPEYLARINDLVRERTTKEDHGIGLRNRIALELYNELDEGEKERLRVVARERFEERKAAYERATQGDLTEAVTDPEVQKEATARLSRVITPLLKIEPGGSYRCVGVHYGQSIRTKQTFAQYDSEAYRDQVIGTFVNYLASTSEATLHDTTPQVVRREKVFRVEMLDPYERERGDKAQELASAEAAKKKKAKNQQKRGKKKQAASASSSQGGTAAVAGEAASPVTQLPEVDAGASTAPGVKPDDVFEGAPVFAFQSQDAANFPSLNIFQLGLPTSLADLSQQQSLSLDPSLLLIPPMPASPDDPLPNFDVEAALLNAPVPGVDFHLDLEDLGIGADGSLVSLALPPSASQPIARAVPQPASEPPSEPLPPSASQPIARAVPQPAS